MAFYKLIPYNQTHQMESRTTLAQGREATYEVKESIRDMIRVQSAYQLPDEVFWDIFNRRVLMNERIDVDDYVLHSYGIKPSGQA